MSISAWESVLSSALETCHLLQVEAAAENQRGQGFTETGSGSWRVAARIERQPCLPSFLSITAKHIMSGLNCRKLFPTVLEAEIQGQVVGRAGSSCDLTSWLAVSAIPLYSYMAIPPCVTPFPRGPS